MTVRDSAHKYIQQLYRTNLIFYFNTIHQIQMESLFKRCQINAIEFFSAHFKKTALPPPEDVGPALYSGHSVHVSGSRVAKIVTLLTPKLWHIPVSWSLCPWVAQAASSWEQGEGWKSWDSSEKVKIWNLPVFPLQDLLNPGEPEKILEISEFSMLR